MKVPQSCVLYKNGQVGKHNLLVWFYQIDGHQLHQNHNTVMGTGCKLGLYRVLNDLDIEYGMAVYTLN